MRYFSYIIARDYGFAPNPFHGYCTLATCKPVIRRIATAGDWIFGTGSVSNKASGKLIYAMRVSEKVTMNQYWLDERFQSKKSIMNGSLKQMYGDNIYHQDANGIWLQNNSHHTHPDGSMNEKNLNKDTSGIYTLISNHFFYFGKSCITIPPNLKDEVCMSTQGFKYVEATSAVALIKYLDDNYSPKRYSYPIQFNKFERFKG